MSVPVTLPGPLSVLRYAPLPSTAMQPRHTIHLGHLSEHLGRAARHLFEVALAPLGLFYLLLTLTNLTGALVAALVWAVGALGWRLLNGKSVPAVLLITTALLVAASAWARRESRGAQHRIDYPTERPELAHRTRTTLTAAREIAASLSDHTELRAPQPMIA